MPVNNLKDTLIDQAPPLGFRFGVFFFANGVLPNPVDFRFRRVSGLSLNIETQTIEEGGQSLFSHRRIPDKIQYKNLLLERGLIIGSPLVQNFLDAASLFQYNPSNVLVTLLNESVMPIAGWLFADAYPVKWSISDLNAEENAVVIETMELAFERMQVMRV